MNFATGLFGTNPSLVPIIARKAEEVGFDSLWTPDHLVPPLNIPSTYPYSDSNNPPFAPESPWLDVFVSLAVAAANTKTLRLGTNVYILPMRNPFVTAKSVASLDVYSEGRVLFGIGVGWMNTEFEVLGENFENRGPRSDEIIDIMRRLWTEETISHQGKYYSFEPLKFEPKPVQRPLPVHVGGTSAVALRRAARLGDGWVGVQSSLEDIQDLCTKLHELRKEAGRENEPFEISVAPSGQRDLDLYRRFEEAGVTRIFGGLGIRRGGQVTPESISEGMERFADKVISKM